MLLEIRVKTNGPKVAAWVVAHPTKVHARSSQTAPPAREVAVARVWQIARPARGPGATPMA